MITTTACLCACAAPPPVVPQAPVRVDAAAADTARETLRVIVRFKADIADPTDPRFLVDLASRAHVTRIEPIRSMSGDAYVMQVSCADPAVPVAARSCEAALSRLNATAGVAYAEPDRREKHQ